MSTDAKAVAAATGKVRVALCQLMVSADKTKNLQSAAEAVRKAHAEHKPDLIVLPEIWNGAYSNDAFPTDAETIPSDATKADPKTQPSSHLISALAKELKVTIVGGSISEREFVDTGAGVQQRLYNTCLVADPSGAFIAKHRKVHLFDIDIPGKITFRESLTLTGGSAYTVCDAPVQGGSAVVRIGVGICYDMRFAEYAMVCAQQYGVRLMVYPGAFNTTTGPLHWELLQRARALDNQLFVVTCSPARNPESKYQAWGHSTAVGPSGDVLATTEHGAAVVVTELDLARVDELRTTIPIGKQKRHDLYAPPTATANAAAATALANGAKPVAPAPAAAPAAK